MVWQANYWHTQQQGVLSECLHASIFICFVHEWSNFYKWYFIHRQVFRKLQHNKWFRKIVFNVDKVNKSWSWCVTKYQCRRKLSRLGTNTSCLPHSVCNFPSLYFHLSLQAPWILSHLILCLPFHTVCTFSTLHLLLSTCDICILSFLHWHMCAPSPHSFAYVPLHFVQKVCTLYYLQLLSALFVIVSQCAFSPFNLSLSSIGGCTLPLIHLPHLAVCTFCQLYLHFLLPNSLLILPTHFAFFVLMLCATSFHSISAFHPRLCEPFLCPVWINSPVL